MEISYEIIADNSYFSKFKFLDQEYKTILYLEDADWSKPVLLGCDQFKNLVSRSNGAERELIKSLMKVKDADNAFHIIKEFIHQYGEQTEKQESNLLEEIREIGFDKVLDTNDEFTRFRLKLLNDDDVTMTLKIFKNYLEYSLDSFEDFPIKKVHDKSKGFLGRAIKSASNDYKEIERISNEIFLKLDEQFHTLKPERFDKRSFKRRIKSGNCEEIMIYYNFETKEIILKHNFSETRYSEPEALFSDLNIVIKTITTVDDENNSKDCGICYSNFLDGILTDFECSNAENCKQVYHVSCLREWFRANPESRTVFDQISGTCLFCDKEIFIKNN